MMQKSRPIEAFQQVLSAFKLFEKKLDKLQDDVNSHGLALSDLRALVSNLAIGSDAKVLPKQDEKRLKKSMAVQYVSNTIQPTEGVKTKRKNTIQAFPTKIKTMSYPTTTLIGTRTGVDPAFGRLASMPKVKHTPRPGKASFPRKATIHRTPKGREKKCRAKPKTK